MAQPLIVLLTVCLAAGLMGKRMRPNTNQQTAAGINQWSGIHLDTALTGASVN